MGIASIPRIASEAISLSTSSVMRYSDSRSCGSWSPTADLGKAWRVHRRSRTRSVSEIDPRFGKLDDWEILVALKQQGGWAGLITSDDDFCRPLCLTALMQTRLAVVHVASLGHDHIRATGLLLAHLGAVCKRLVPNTPQIWRLSMSEKHPEDPWAVLSQYAARQQKTAKELHDANRLTPEKLNSNPLVRRWPDQRHVFKVPGSGLALTVFLRCLSL